MTAKMPFLPRLLGARLNALGRAGAPEDVSHLARFLVSKASAGIDGQLIRCCGGMWAGR